MRGAHAMIVEEMHFVEDGSSGSESGTESESDGSLIWKSRSYRLEWKLLYQQFCGNLRYESKIGMLG